MAKLSRGARKEQRQQAAQGNLARLLKAANRAADFLETAACIIHEESIADAEETLESLGVVDRLRDCIRCAGGTPSAPDLEMRKDIKEEDD
jgi:hypothetical protein